MVVYHFPEGDPDLVGIVSYSPLDKIVCPRKPFGDVSAEDYLEFAKAGFGQGGRDGLVNALGNAKRCFHYQVDRLLYRYGLREATSELDFPSKLALLRDLRVVSGSLMRFFNRQRNLMEHEYIAPARETIENSIDLCELLLLATERYLTDTPGRMRFVLANDDRDILLLLVPGANRIERFVINGTTSEETPHGTLYKGSILRFGSHKLQDGITVKAVPDEDVALRLDVQDEWLPILRAFCAVARGCESHPRYPEEPTVVVQHHVTLGAMKAALEGEDSGFEQE